MSDKGSSLKHLVSKRLDAESMADEYAMDISASVYKRMAELGLKQQDLAERMGVTPARVSRILKGNQGINFSTLAKLEDALEFDMSYGFREPRREVDSEYRALIKDYEYVRVGLEKHDKANLGDYAIGASK